MNCFRLHFVISAVKNLNMTSECAALDLKLLLTTKI